MTGMIHYPMIRVSEANGLIGLLLTPALFIGFAERFVLTARTRYKKRPHASSSRQWAKGGGRGVFVIRHRCFFWVIYDRSYSRIIFPISGTERGF